MELNIRELMALGSLLRNYTLWLKCLTFMTSCSRAPPLLVLGVVGALPETGLTGFLFQMVLELGFLTLVRGHYFVWFRIVFLLWCSLVTSGLVVGPSDSLIFVVKIPNLEV